jgi:FMN reductase
MTSSSATSSLLAVAVNGSPSRPSRSRLLAERVLASIEVLAAASSGADRGGLVTVQSEVIDLADLDPSALLAMGSDPGVDSARDRVAEAHILVVATPVYRATYTALTKTVFDLLPQGALEGTAVVPIATGYGRDHQLAVDHGLRPLVASLGGWTVPTGLYATKADVGDDGTVTEPLAARIEAAAGEALLLARALGGGG